MPHRLLDSLACLLSPLLLCWACGGADADPLQRSIEPANAPAQSGAGAAPPASPATGSTTAPGMQAAPANGNVETSPVPSALAGGDAASQGLPCGVRGIFQQNCVRCHAATPQFGAPMPLVTYADLTAPAVSQPGRSVYDLVLERVDDDARPMPPVPNERLSADERSALRAWVNGGTLQANELCRAVEQAAPPETFIGRFPDEADCDVPLELRAHDAADAFSVPQEDDHYECFYFQAPIEPVQVLGFEPLIDDSRVVHHWLLYTSEDGGLSDGSRETCNGIHPDATLLNGWAPGGVPYGTPEGVGIQVPNGANARFILEIHYNNVARHTDARDRSGVRLCATRKPQPNVAAIHWLGTENVLLLPGRSDAGSTCRPEVSEPVHLLSITPHMHELGVHSSVVLNRADGSKETLLDKPFDFNTQVGYATPAVLQPGDSLTATCSWNNDRGGITRFGESTSDEMCYFFTLAYPAGSLDTGGNFLLPGFLGGVNKCMR